MLNPNFLHIKDTKFKLQDMVMTFYNGQNNIIISLKTLQKYLIINTKYYFDNHEQDITITFCPYSSAIVIYYDKFELTDQIINNNIVLKHGINNYLINQLSGSLINAKGCYLKKISNRILTIRQMLSSYIDCLYLQDIKDNSTNKKNKNNKLVKDNKNNKLVKDNKNNKLIVNNINNKLFNDNNEQDKKLLYDKDNINFVYDSELIIYGIEYISSKSNKCSDTKRTAIICNKNYNYDNYKKYLKKYEEKLIEKNAIIYPCKFKSWISFFPDSKIIVV